MAPDDFHSIQELTSPRNTGKSFLQQKFAGTDIALPDNTVKSPDYKSTELPSDFRPQFTNKSDPNHVHDVSEIPEERMQLMRERFIKLKKKFPHMTDHRIGRKVAEYFKIKVV